jgi:phosphoribosyl-ATP pyrophosphohydrolase
MSVDVIDKLKAVLEARKRADPSESYVARLYAGGIDAILKKVGEEAAETIVAAKNGARGEIVHEVADLWFHSLIMLAALDIDSGEVFRELEFRYGRSGLEEKASRNGAGSSLSRGS